MSAPKDGKRVPDTLQTVLIVSQRGKDVAKPPPNGVAFKSFRWFQQNKLQSDGTYVTDGMEGTVGSDDTMSTDDGSLFVQQVSPAMPSDGMRKSDSKTNLNAPPPPNAARRTISKQHEPLLMAHAVVPPKRRTKKHISPQAYLTSMLTARGYNTTLHAATEGGYFNTPTPYQLASFGAFVEHAILNNDADLLRSLLEAGLCPNACDYPNGVSLMHLTCRLGHKECFNVLLEFGASVEIVDSGTGRTPLHEACKSRDPCFAIVHAITHRNRRLFYLADAQGRLPLSLVPESRWTRWTRFLMKSKATYWPERDVKQDGFEKEDEVAIADPDTHPFPPMLDLVCLSTATLVAQGRLEPSPLLLQREAAIKMKRREQEQQEKQQLEQQQQHHQQEDEEEEVWKQQQHQSVDRFTEPREEVLHEHDEELDEDDDINSEATFDEDEMNEILGCIGSSKPLAWASRSA